MHDLYRLIDADPEFHALQRARSRFSWGLLACVFVAFYSFLSVIAFAPTWFSRPLNAHTMVTTGIAAGVAVILFSVVLTAWYVWRANREFDVRNQVLLARLKQRATTR
ncbi:MAG: DUF485 domain-containing protein [Gammaproteobacteria bacterium]|nr:DUF485 domain-containing protein [Gammaproteobacteria bacterium]